MEQLTQTTVEMTSVDIADITSKRHCDVMRDIRNEIENLGELGLRKFGESSTGWLIFEQSYYINSQNKKQPCFRFGKKGAMQLALKYDAKTRFKVIEYLEKLEGEQVQTAKLSPQLQLLINMEIEQKKQKAEIANLNNKVEGIKEVVALNPESWRKETKALITKIAGTRGGFAYIREVNNEIYKLLCQRMHVDIKTRKRNKQKRMAAEGACKTKIENISYVDVIADDPKLIEGYIAIVKEMAVASGVT